MYCETEHKWPKSWMGKMTTIRGYGNSITEQCDNCVAVRVTLQPVDGPEIVKVVDNKEILAPLTNSPEFS